MKTQLKKNRAEILKGFGETRCTENKPKKHTITNLTISNNFVSQLALR